MFIHVLFELFGEFEYRMIELFQIFFMIWSNIDVPTTQHMIELKCRPLNLLYEKQRRLEPRPAA